jgi:uncharacterized membrane protein YoaK (UPF0700 family)
MPINYARRLTGPKRSPRADRRLGFVLAFVAGAANAGGFLAVQQYTSHMTGVVSSMADNLILGAYASVFTALGALVAFVLGAATSAVMVNFAKRRKMHSIYAMPLLFEAFLLLCFGSLGGWLAHLDWLFVPATVLLLCYMMGLQNAVITKLSNAEIRTTHITGVITDIGIELGKFLYVNRSSHLHSPDGKPLDAPTLPNVVANKARLRLLCALAGSFFAGGVIGAFGFKQFGYIATVPLALLLMTIAIVPAIDDVRRQPTEL